jgi:hypothetical protein
MMMLTITKSGAFNGQSSCFSIAQWNGQCIVSGKYMKILLVHRPLVSQTSVFDLAGLAKLTAKCIGWACGVEERQMSSLSEGVSSSVFAGRSH